MEQSTPTGGEAQTAAVSAAAAPQPPVPLQVVQFPDGSGQVGVPAGWTPTLLHQGSAILAGPDGANVTIGAIVDLLDPRGFAAQTQPWSGLQLLYSPDPVQTFVNMNRGLFAQMGRPDPQTTIESVTPMPVPPPTTAAKIFGTETINGAQVRFAATIFVNQPRPDGSWVVTISVASAPVVSWSRAEAVMVAIENSYGVRQWATPPPAMQSAPPPQQMQSAPPPHPPGVAPQPNAAQAMTDVRSQMNATFQGSMNDARQAQTLMDKSTASFIKSEFGD